MSDPMAADQSSSCRVVAGRPAASLAAHSVVAALPLHQANVHIREAMTWCDVATR